MQDMSKSDDVKKGLDGMAKVQKMSVEDIGFGIKVIKATILLNDKEGGWDAAEEKIKKLNNVSELEVENITRI